MTLRQRLLKFGYQVAHQFRRVYWFILRPKTRGAKCLIECNGKFLLVRLNYAHQRWTLPGGGVDRGETFKDGAIREAREEVGITVGDVRFIGSYQSIVEYKQNTVEVYVAHIQSERFVIDPIEIKEAKWFAKEDFPEDKVASLGTIMEMYERNR